MGPPTNVRFNAKGRSGRPHKKRKLNRKQPAVELPVKNALHGVDLPTIAGDEQSPRNSLEDQDSEPQVIVHKTESQKEEDRKFKLMQEMMEASESKWTRKKKKRLEAYIEKKLKKEERLKILDKLIQTQAEVDHMQLQSTATLGSGHAYTHAQRLALAEDQDVRRALETRGGRRKRSRGGLLPSATDGDESEDESLPSSDQFDTASDFGDVEEWNGLGNGVPENQQPFAGPSTASPAVVQVGSALQRNADGTVVAPRVVHRKPKRKRGRNGAWNPNLPSEKDEDQDPASDASSSSFDSSASSTQSALHSGAANHSFDTSGLEESSASSGSGGDSQVGTKRKRYGGFKAWAQRQLNAVKTGEDDDISREGHSIAPAVPLIPTEYYALLPDHLRADPHKLPVTAKVGPLGEELVLPDTELAKHILTRDAGSSHSKKKKTALKRHIVVERSEEVEEARMHLPILAEEQVIVETILLNPIVVICGETGSGKTTQVPQFLYEAGFGSPGTDNPGMIGITQPRRVAAMSMASRVSHELALPSNRVSYQIRYDATVSPETSIKFMTDGVLLRELAGDFLLTKYSVIIVDEAHERSMNTDILIGVLSRVLKLREEMWTKKKSGMKPLRLIIMSATLRVSDFTENKTLFPVPPPIINVNARQFPVAIHYNRKTTHDYINEVVKKAVKIHCRLPHGGILIFLTGQNEIQDVCRKLEKRFGKKTLEEKQRIRHEAFGTKGLASKMKGWIDGGSKDAAVIEKTDRLNAREGVVEADELELGSAPQLDVIDEASGIAEADALDSDSENGSDSGQDDIVIDPDDSDVPLHVVPLYSMLPHDKQMKVFDQPPAGTRLVVVATNVAETSLTIPGITYVIDAGRSKQRHYDAQTSIESFRVGWVSKASAAQRAGRAGRTGPGHCYRLYSSAFYENHFSAFDEPEILRMPIEGVVLQMKAMHIDAVVNFPFPTPPDRIALKKAETVLTNLGALSEPIGSSQMLRGDALAASCQITALGRAMALFPVSPRFAKILVVGRQQGCLPYVIAIVAALAVGDPFLREDAVNQDDDQQGHDGPSSQIESAEVQAKEERRMKRRSFFRSQAIHTNLGDGKSDAFRMLSVVGAYEYDGGRMQFCDEHFVRPKAMEEIHKLRSQLSYIVHANFADADSGFEPKIAPPDDLQLKALRQLLAAGFIDRVAVRKSVVEKSTAKGAKYTSCHTVPYRAMGVDEDVFVHPSSVVYHQSPPDWVVFQDVVRSTRVWIKGITIINPSWLPALGPSLCTYSKPLDLPPSLKKLGAEVKIVTPRFGPHGWQLPNTRL